MCMHIYTIHRRSDISSLRGAGALQLKKNRCQLNDNYYYNYFRATCARRCSTARALFPRESRRQPRPSRVYIIIIIYSDLILIMILFSPVASSRFKFYNIRERAWCCSECMFTKQWSWCDWAARGRGGGRVYRLRFYASTFSADRHLFNRTRERIILYTNLFVHASVYYNIYVYMYIFTAAEHENISPYNVRRYI